jgi:uncharacterized membrane-anchored protein YhcB (DUF1043 family)
LHYMTKPWRNDILIPTIIQAIHHHYLLKDNFHKEAASQETGNAFQDYELGRYKQLAKKYAAAYHRLVDFIKNDLKPFVEHVSQVSETLSQNGSEENRELRSINTSSKKIMNILAKIG